MTNLYLLFSLIAQQTPADVPRSPDARLVIERFAASPDIVHPVGVAFDARGRLLVIESHTHFPPKDYKGPKHDRIRVLEDTDGDGKADRFTTFYEGTTHTMDIAAHPDGSIYIATRNEILRLRDTDGDGKADKADRIVFLETKGNYPHNGLSGLSFDSKGNLFFGMGENLGASYKLSGSDGTTLTGEGEGGNILWCTADGKKLRRVATGFWNPFGTCIDIYGRMFAVDNDPDAMPPCRMMHVVEGADFGYQFRYGRSGRHPFQAWNGQLPGTLPMVSGTGEAPCEIISYESDGLPREYLGDLLVASWADHRVERYVLKERGASFTAEQKPFIQGGKDFRPVGIAVAPDGSLFVSDWVKADYTLHGHGAIWHIRMKEAKKPERPKEPRQALLSAHRPMREAAAQQLVAEGEKGLRFLRDNLKNDDVRVRAACLTALIDGGNRNTDLRRVADKDGSAGLRACAVRELAARGDSIAKFLEPSQPASLRLEAIGGLRGNRVLEFLADKDPYLRNAAVQRVTQLPRVLDSTEMRSLTDPVQRAGLLLAHRAAGRIERIPQYLADSDEDVRFLGVKWISDEKLTVLRAHIVEALKNPRLSARMYLALTTALTRIDNQDVSEGRMADYFVAQLLDGKASPATRIMALRMIPATHQKLTIDALAELLKQDDGDLKREAVRTLREHPTARRFPVLRDLANNSKLPDALRAEAIVGLADRSEEESVGLLKLAQSDQRELRDEALRALAQTKLTNEQQKHVMQVGTMHESTADLAQRVLGKPHQLDRPKADDIVTWMKRLDGPADVEAGRRVFFHPKLGMCARCHRVEGRGQDVGPDLSGIGRTERKFIVESILQPDANVAPHYQAWNIETTKGQTYTGMLLRTYLDEYTYLDAKGNQFKLTTRDMADVRPAKNSIMPTGLVDLLTDQELRDLLAFLAACK